MADFLNRDTILSSLLHGGAAIVCVFYLFPGQVQLGTKAITAGIILGVVTMLVDKVYPRVSTFVAGYGV